MKARLVLLALAGATLVIPAAARAACQPIANPLGGNPVATVCQNQYQSGSDTVRNVTVSAGSKYVFVDTVQRGGSYLGAGGTVQTNDGDSQTYATEYVSVAHHTGTGRSDGWASLVVTNNQLRRTCILTYSNNQDDIMTGGSSTFWNCYQF